MRNILNMIKDFFGRCKYILKDTIYKLKGHEKRNTIAHIAKEFGCGGAVICGKRIQYRS